MSRDFRADLLLVGAIMAVALSSHFGWWIIAGGVAAGLMIAIRDDVRDAA